MPRLHAVSDTTTEWCVRRNPNPLTQSLWFGIALQVLRTNVTFNFLVDIIIFQQFLQLFYHALQLHILESIHFPMHLMWLLQR